MGLGTWGDNLQGEICPRLSPSAVLRCTLPVSGRVPVIFLIQNQQEISTYTLLFQIKPKLIEFSKTGVPQSFWTSGPQSLLQRASRALYTLIIELYLKKIETADIVSQTGCKLLIVSSEILDHSLGVSCSRALNKSKPSMKENELRNLSEEIGHLRHTFFYTPE